MPTFESFSFPRDVGWSAVGGPAFRTDVVTTAYGAEQRNGASGVHARRIFDIDTDTLSVALRDELFDFYDARRGSTDSFRFLDPFDYIATAQPLVSVSGGRQLVKNYVIGSTTYQRPIIKPINSITLTGGGSVDYETGLVTGGSGGTWSGQFEIQARFVDDQLEAASTTSAHEAVSLTLIEVFDYDWPAVTNSTPPVTLGYTLTLPVEVGRRRRKLWNTHVYQTGTMEERTQQWATGRTFFDAAVALLKDRTSLDTLMALFLVARGRRSRFTYDTYGVRFAVDRLVCRNTGSQATWTADIPMMEA